MITLNKLDLALDQTVKELAKHGFWTDSVYRTEVYLTPLSLVAYGWQFYRGTGHIHIPSVVVTGLLGKLFGRGEGYTLRDVLRHEYGHAVAHHHPGLMRSIRFREAFGAPHDTREYHIREYHPWQHVSRYAATHPSEDFAETFMCYLRHRGKLPGYRNTTAIRGKWKFIDQLGKTLGQGKRRW